MAAINITSFCSLVCASFVVACMIAKRADGITAMSSTWYADSDCTEPTSSVLLFYLETGDNFNQCSTDGNISYSTTCDSSTGEYGAGIYEDTECVEVFYEEIFSHDCLEINTTSSDQQVFSTVECSDEEPSVISPNTFNYLAEEYTDDGCTNPTGNTEILSVGYDGTCVQDEYNSSWSLSECLADGSEIVQLFTLDDDTCSGDVWTEAQIAYGTSLFSCWPFESDGLYYYNIMSCTTESASLFGAFGTLAPATTAPFTLAPAATSFTPAPSMNNDSDVVPTIITDAPSPVAIQETGAPITEILANTTMETPAPTTSEEAVSPNTVAPATTTSDTISPSATEATVAPDNTGAPNTSGVEAESGAIRTKNTGVAAGAVAIICGLGLVVGRMR